MPDILLELQFIAPVSAVAGNTDDPGFRYRPTQFVELAGKKFLLHHILDPRALRDDLKLQIKREHPDVVVFGHTHRPFSERIGRTLFFNPGYAGRPKHGAERSVAILHCEGREVRPEFISL